MVPSVKSNERSTQRFQMVRYNNIAVRRGHSWENTTSVSAAVVTSRRTGSTNARKVILPALGALKCSLYSVFRKVQRTVER